MKGNGKLIIHEALLRHGGEGGMLLFKLFRAVIQDGGELINQLLVHRGMNTEEAFDAKGVYVFLLSLIGSGRNHIFIIKRIFFHNGIQFFGSILKHSTGKTGGQIAETVDGDSCETMDGIQGTIAYFGSSGFQTAVFQSGIPAADSHGLAVSAVAES